MKTAQVHITFIAKLLSMHWKVNHRARIWAWIHYMHGKTLFTTFHDPYVIILNLGQEVISYSLVTGNALGLTNGKLSTVEKGQIKKS